MVDVSLYQKCSSKVINMLQTNYLRTDMSPNPFLSCPPKIINDLIERICQNAGGRLNISSLRLLLSSGRIQDFKLCNVELESSDAESIFQDLQSSSQILKSITIQDVFLEGSDLVSNLGSLIRLSKSLTSVETCIGFPLSEVFYSESLKNLTLNYVILDRLKSYSELRRVPHYNNTLRVLKLFKAQANPNLRREIADIMQYCTELIEIDYDVAETLEYIYEKNKSKKFKLQTTILGSDASCFAKRANQVAIVIASMVCPDLQSVELVPDDYRSIRVLSHFNHINVLTVNKPRLSFNDYHIGIHPLLQTPHFGTNLKNLTLSLFSEVDFASIGICCPNIEVLNVEYFSADNTSDLPQNVFQKLSKLKLIKLFNGPCEVSTIFTILCNASDLKHLEINSANTFNDNVLDNILEKDGLLAQLKCITLRDCGLTAIGWKKLARRASSLKEVTVSSSSVSELEARCILHDIKLNTFQWSN